MNQNLHFNILTFKPSSEELTFYFTDVDSAGLVRLTAYAVPNEVVTHFGEQEFYYTSFSPMHEGFLAVTKRTTPAASYSVSEDGEEIKKDIPNSAFAVSILKKYYNSLIAEYFKSEGCLVMPNFINATEIWLPEKTKETTGTYNQYRKFSLKVQKAVISDQWEMMVIYEGISKIFIQSVEELKDDIPSKAYNWVVHQNKFYRFSNMPLDVRRNLDAVYPVWNFSIREVLQQKTVVPNRTNRYRKFKNEIEELYTDYLNKAGFHEIINLSQSGFIPVPERKIGEVGNASNRMLFGNNHTDISPMKGLTNYGPYDVSDASVIEFFYIFHEDNKDAVLKLHEYFQGKKDSFKGLDKFILTSYHPDKNLKIVFHDKDNPWPEINEGLRNLKTDKNIRYVAIYVSPFSKEEATPLQKKIYYHLKERLLHLGILSQVIDAKKTIHNTMFQYSALNMAIAILAKLEGTPWRLQTDLKKELVVGVGAFHNKENDVKYIASAFSFNNTGQFNCFDHFFSNQTKELAGSIIRQVKEYTSLDPTLKRLVIHFYKTLSRKEMEPIEKGLQNLGINIPVFIVSINKTESTDIIAFDSSFENLMPFSGTYINVGYRKYILFNNTRYRNAIFRPSDGFPFPLKLQMFCSQSDLLKDTKTVKELIEQVYQFSRMYWKSVKQQNLPVTIKYSEMVAEMLPNFQGTEIPDFGKDKLWFL